MNKEHIFTIAVDVDDDAIRSGVVKAVEKQVVETIKEDLFDKDSWGRRNRISSRLMDQLTAVIKGVIDENKEFILQEVVKNLTEKVYRSKAFKERVGDQV